MSYSAGTKDYKEVVKIADELGDELFKHKQKYQHLTGEDYFFDRNADCPCPYNYWTFDGGEHWWRRDALFMERLEPAPAEHIAALMARERLKEQLKLEFGLTFDADAYLYRMGRVLQTQAKQNPEREFAIELGSGTKEECQKE